MSDSEAYPVSLLAAVRLLRGAFPRQSFNKESEGAYCLGLVEFDPSEVTYAVQKLIETSTSLPTVAEIRMLLGAPAGAELEDHCPVCKSSHVAIWKSEYGNIVQQCENDHFGLRSVARDLNAGRTPRERPANPRPYVEQPEPDEFADTFGPAPAPPVATMKSLPFDA